MELINLLHFQSHPADIGLNQLNGGHSTVAAKEKNSTLTPNERHRATQRALSQNRTRAAAVPPAYDKRCTDLYLALISLGLLKVTSTVDLGVAAQNDW